MIDANELRKGNLLFNKVQVITVSTIGYDGINHWQDMGASGCEKFSDLYPVILTGEILEKSGMEKTFYGWDHLETAFEIAEIEPGVFMVSINENEYTNGSEFRYVHELQNIYYWTERKELEIKL